MEEEVADLFVDMWAPLGRAATATAALAMLYMKVKGVVRGLTPSGPPLEAQMPQAMDWGSLLAASLHNSAMRPAFARCAPIARTRETLHGPAISRERKIELWEALRMDALTALVAVPYCNAVVATMCALRGAVAVLLVRRKEHEARKAPRAGAPGNGSSDVAGGMLMSVMASLAMQLGTASPFANCDVGAELHHVQPLVTHRVAFLFSVARTCVERWFPADAFAVTKAVSAAQLLTALRRARADFEGSVDWRCVLEPPLGAVDGRNAAAGQGSEGEEDLRALALLAPTSGGSGNHGMANGHGNGHASRNGGSLVAVHAERAVVALDADGRPVAGAVVSVDAIATTTSDGHGFGNGNGHTNGTAAHHAGRDRSPGTTPSVVSTSSPHNDGDVASHRSRSGAGGGFGGALAAAAAAVGPLPRTTAEVDELVEDVSRDESFERLVFAHADSFARPFLEGPAADDGEAPNVAATASGSGDALAASGDGCGELERAVRACKSYNPATGQAAMLQVVLGLLWSAERLMDAPLRHVPPLTRAFCTELVRASAPQ